MQRMFWYGDIWGLLAEWCDAGLLFVPDDKTLDKFILETFGYPGDDWSPMSVDLFSRKLDVDWLFGPYGLSLLKMKLLRDGL